MWPFMLFMFLFVLFDLCMHLSNLEKQDNLRNDVARIIGRIDRDKPPRKPGEL